MFFIVWFDYYFDYKNLWKKIEKTFFEFYIILKNLGFWELKRALVICNKLFIYFVSIKMLIIKYIETNNNLDGTNIGNTRIKIYDNKL